MTAVGGSRGGGAGRIGLGLAGIGALSAALYVRAWGAGLDSVMGIRYPALLALLGLGAVSCAWGALRGRTPEVGPGQLIRLTFVALVAAWVLSLLAFSEVREPLVVALLGLAAGGLGVVVLVRERVPTGLRRRLSFLDPLAFGLALAPVLAECALWGVQRAVRPVLLADMGSARAWIEAARLPAGKLRFGLPLNSRGYSDGEPPAPGTTKLALVLGDSFGVGAVASPLHYTAVAEGELPGVEVYNLAIIGTDPRHYVEMLRDEALALAPDVIVVGLFVGNDLVIDDELAQPLGFWSSLFDRESRLVARFLVRAARLLRERGRAEGTGEPAGRVQGEEVQNAVPEAELSLRFPWFADPMLEQPTFSRAGFVKIETQRAQITRPDQEYPGLAPLLEMKALVGAIPFLVLVIPDEFQVEEALWDEIAQPGFERDRPQREVARFCAENDIELLDVLPALRSVPPMADGCRHLYMLQDTHWNARGNEVAGRELGRALRRYFER